MDKDGSLRSIFRAQLPTWHWVTVETGLLGRGIPDSEYCSPAGVSGWIEYKYTDAWAIEIAPEQVAWALRRFRSGGRSYIAVRRRHMASPRRAACDELWLVRGQFAAEVKDLGLRCDPRAVLGTWPGGPSAWAWAEVAAHLEGPLRAVRPLRRTA